AAELARSGQWPDTRRARTAAALPPRWGRPKRRARGACTAPDTPAFLKNEKIAHNTSAKNSLALRSCLAKENGAQMSAVFFEAISA
ncbi:MAG TPA: hypothetical protein VL002_18160, partial [Candidimonas sp.]|nr:hypothetical protein [Candidimonas sp.]